MWHNQSFSQRNKATKTPKTAERVRKNGWAE